MNIKLWSLDLDIETDHDLIGGLSDTLSELQAFVFIAYKESAASQAETLNIHTVEREMILKEESKEELPKDERSSDPKKVLDATLTQLNDRDA